MLVWLLLKTNLLPNMSITPELLDSICSDPALAREVIEVQDQQLKLATLAIQICYDQLDDPLIKKELEKWL